MWYVVAVLMCNLSVLASGKLNYCGARMCSHTDAHTFCQFTQGGPGSQCIGYVETPLSTEEKIRLVIRLNQRRAAVASGRLRGFPTAGNMMKLLWIEELAREAQLWADQCEPPSTPEENDACRDLYSVAVGQCVASVIGEAPGLRPESMVDIWYMQNKFYRGNITSFDPPVHNRYNYYGDFAQLVYSKTYMVGCGRSRFMVLMSGRLRSVERLVCNFAPRGPSSGRPLWTVASPGTACPPRSLPDVNVPALCAAQRELDETHDQDNLMHLEEHVLLETVFEVDKNESLNYLGSLDEIFLTKVAVATINDVVTMPSDYSLMQKRDLIDPYNLSNTDIYKENTVVYQMNEHKITTEMFKPKPKVVFIGRPKSYNVEELNEDEQESKDDNTDTQMQDLPIKEGRFDVDYEFNESTDERKVMTTEQTTSHTSIDTTTFPITITTFVGYENTNWLSTTNATLVKNAITEETTTAQDVMGVTPYTNIEFINNFKDYVNQTTSENYTEALLEEYLSDPETVRRLQEELDRLELAMAIANQKTQTQEPATERADKVRRALRDFGVTYSDRAPAANNDSQANESMTIPQLLEMFSDDDRNKSVVSPMMSMAMKYIPYLKDYKAGIMKRAFSRSTRFMFSWSTSVLAFLLTYVL